MMKLNRKHKLITTIRTHSILALLLLAFFVSAFQIIFYSQNFTTQSNLLRKNSIKTQKDFIKREVNFALHTIIWAQNSHKTLTKKQLRSKLLIYIASIRFGKSGYIFANTFKGRALVSNGNIVKGNKKIWEVFSKNVTMSKYIYKTSLHAAHKPHGGYVHYSLMKPDNPHKAYPKTSFIKRIPKENWYIGAGVYLDEVENKIALLHKELKKNLLTHIITIFLITIAITILAILILNFLKRKLQSEFSKMLNSFNAAADEDISININKIHFEELAKIATKTNRIIQQKKLAEEKMLEEKAHQNKMSAIGQLAGGVAHDFNNILAGIIGVAQLLKSPKRNLDEKGIKYVDMISESVFRAAGLTAKLLAFGRRGEIGSTAIDIHTVVDAVEGILKSTIDKKIKISLQKDAQNSTIIGDNTALQNAIMNLGINASHAMPEGGELQIMTKNMWLDEVYCEASSFVLESGEYIEIRVQDSGTGIPAEIVQKIFEPFFTTKEQGKGTGLGLSAVYGTVEDHHGAISVYSELGSGTLFSLCFPCSGEIVKEEKKEIVVLSGSGKILLVDDENLIRVTGKYMLEDMGYQVIIAENGQEAVRIFEKDYTEIDLIIMDMIMPEMNGREAFHKMREIDEDCKVVISSGFTKDESLSELKEAGLAGFINKPFSDYELSRLLDDLLKK